MLIFKIVLIFDACPSVRNQRSEPSLPDENCKLAKSISMCEIRTVYVNVQRFIDRNTIVSVEWLNTLLSPVVYKSVDDCDGSFDAIDD